MNEVIVIGAGGHARNLLDILHASDCTILGALVHEYKSDLVSLDDMPILGDDSLIDDYDPNTVLLVNAIGSTSRPKRRDALFAMMKKKNFTFLKLQHSSAIVSPRSELHEGSQIMAGAIVQSSAKIGKNTIINTGCIVEHDVTVGRSCHIAPGVVVSGSVAIGDVVHIGTGARVINDLTIGSNVLIGAGVTVINNVPDNTVIKTEEFPVWN